MEEVVRGGGNQVYNSGWQSRVDNVTSLCLCRWFNLEPALIYQSTSGSIQDSWLKAFDLKDHQARFTSSPTGWTNNEIDQAWLKQVFDRDTKAKLDPPIDYLSLTVMGLILPWILFNTVTRTRSCSQSILHIQSIRCSPQMSVCSGHSQQRIPRRSPTSRNRAKTSPR